MCNIKRLNKKLNEYKSLIEVIYILASIATIVSIFIALMVYFEDKRIKEENEQIIINNLIEEIDFNLEFISIVQEKFDQYIKSYEFTANRYHYFYMERAIDIVENNELRKIMFASINIMKSANIVLNRFSDNLYFPTTKAENEAYRELRKQTITAVRDKSDFIKARLEYIKDELLK
jgi:putative effector of murein hydrolase